MNVRRYVSLLLGANCYLLTDKNLTLIIDPCVEYQQLKRHIKSEVKGILLTHGHYDHFCKILSYFENTNCNLYIHEKCLSKLNNAIKNCSKLCGEPFELDIEKYKDRITIIKENELKFNDVIVKCIYTPGHTDCSMTYLIEENMFTGDFLFKKSIGRTDLFSGNVLDMRKSLESLNKYRSTSFYVYPGHDDDTTLAYEFDNNYYLE